MRPDGACPHCGWTEGHPVDCPEYVARPEPPMWSYLSGTKKVVPSPDGKTVTLRPVTLMDFTVPRPN